MSERWDEEAAAVQQPAPDGVTAGTLLRRAREAAGLHVAALAVSLKVPVKKLEALEDDRWDLLPDMVFVRALAFSVCRTLKIDPQPIIERLPQMVMPRLVRASDGINTPFRAPSDGAPPTWFDQLTKPVYLAVFALLLGALVLILLPRTQQEKEGNQVTTASSQAAAVNGEVVSAPQPFVIPAPAPASSPAAMPPSGASTALTTAAVAPMAVPVAASVPAKAASGAAAAASAPAVKASAPATATPAAAISPSAAASGIVVFRAKGTSWVEVTDAKGVVAMRKELRAGEAAGVSGILPLQVTIGRVDQTDVQVRGKAFDLRPVSKDNVARFTVK
ncbi:RodZ domain-containing protein [Ramlibacter sp. WS9]|uniref:helix-turn-helix domain-containing protein n=1 Tax=Ramlibacter sp. WS9 TaxID=1882741 RepID=UPI001143D28C|nr:RodZ domain-containing protein [Ramlibacter sp. WS9]ROZ62379.1 helix-turn-helix domain-containing protein [Ramlibacter sp. WS9]